MKKIILTLVLIFVIIPGIVYAAINWYIIPNQLTIIETSQNADINAYVDNGGTISLEAIYWGTEIQQGESYQFTYYVKNDGNAIGEHTVYSAGVIDWGTVNYNPSVISLSPGEVVPITVTLTVDIDATPGTYSFNMIGTD